MLGRAFQATIPVMIGYVPLGAAFGLLFADLGHPWWLATMMSIVVYAGSAQFLAVGLLGAGTGLAEIAVATLILNARHAFFGVSLLEKWRPVGRLKKAYLVFGLTDETFALISGMKPPEGVEETDFHLAITAFNQTAWVVGSTVGAALGQAVPFDTTGMDFALTALFVVLVVEQLRDARTWLPAVMALLVGLGMLSLMGGSNMLLVSIGLSLMLLYAAGRKRGWA